MVPRTTRGTQIVIFRNRQYLEQLSQRTVYSPQVRHLVCFSVQKPCYAEFRIRKGLSVVCLAYPALYYVFCKLTTKLCIIKILYIIKYN